MVKLTKFAKYAQFFKELCGFQEIADERIISDKGPGDGGESGGFGGGLWN